MQRNTTALRTRASSSQDAHSISVLWQTIEEVAREREHRPLDVARYVGLHAAHYYRIRKSPAGLARCRPEVLRRLAQYINWTVLDVYLGAGLIDPGDLWVTPTRAEILRGALRKLALSRFASGVTTPLDQATPDHQLLMARLHAAVLGSALTLP